MIDSPMTPVIVPGDEAAADWVAKLEFEHIPSGMIARALQAYVVQIPARARCRLLSCGHAAFRHSKVRGDQFCVLETLSLYHADSGLWWEDAEYLTIEAGII